MELGERILVELGDPRTNDTLLRWLAHHTAGLIAAADQAADRGAPDADDRATRARAAILGLWQHRSAWPSGWPPPRAASLVRLLDRLPEPDDSGWGAHNLLGELQLIHYRLLAALTDFAVADGGDIEQGWLSTFGQRLTPDEVALLTRVVNAPRRVAAWLSPDRTPLRPRAQQLIDSSGTDANTPEAGDSIGQHGATDEQEEAAPTKVVLELAGAYHEAVADLVRRGTADADEPPFASDDQDG